MQKIGYLRIVVQVKVNPWSSLEHLEQKLLKTFHEFFFVSAFSHV